MAQDLRELMNQEKYAAQRPSLSNGHESRFLSRLAEEIPEEKKSNSYLWMKIAAVLVVVLATSFFLKNQAINTRPEVPMITNASTESLEVSPVYLSDVSPQFKKIEDYYLGNINAELAQLTITNDNKELIDSFMLQLEELDKEYTRLNEEMDETGVNEAAVNSLVNNLELRLGLLSKLKSKLGEIKQASQENIQGVKI
ncbi:hypothetical protein RBU60_05700 [Mesonia sp. MT50]|uniref:Anti-sigma factor n=1 Tax=Mesonia profundi TaxID=3070998 RepID=A0ABU1A040_9FLAO|nr:hypothetical protein [Mesonia profundi]MDQ7917063.1 hypothetical protein [Mesonia profundi]